MCSRQKVEINAHVCGILIWLQAVNAVVPSAYSARLLRTQAAITTGPDMLQNRIRSDVRRPEIKKIHAIIRHGSQL